MSQAERNTVLDSALVLAALLLWILSRSMTTGAAAVLVLLISRLLSRRVNLDRVGQAALGIVLVFSAVLLEMVLPGKTPHVPPTLIGPLSRAAALGFLAVAASRSVLTKPVGQDPVTAGFGFLAVLSMGSAGEGFVYPIVSGIILVLLVFGAGYRNRILRPVGGATRKRRRLLLFVFGTAAFIFVSLIVSLPRMYQAAFGLFERTFSDVRTGFGYGLYLGDLNGMQQSDETVMRVRGRRADYLRGAVYVRYSHGQWLRPSIEKRTAVRFPDDTVASENSTEILFVGGDRNRFFLPLGSVVTGMSPDRGRMTTQGILTPERDEEVERIRFAVSAKNTVDTPAPTVEQLFVPEEIEGQIRRIALSWTGGRLDAERSMQRLTEKLKREFTYSLAVESGGDTDPILTFLLSGKKGNCEYFAAALALTARTLGVPTRVIGGYRVHEYNPIGGYYLVREKNAHAWVEAYLPRRGWTSFDPTPSAGEVGGSSDMSLGAALLDAAVDRLRAGVDRLSRMTATQLLTAIAVLVLVWFAMRVIRALRKPDADRDTRKAGYAAPPKAVVRLLARISESGRHREPNEPLERYLLRLRRGSEHTSPPQESTALLSRYVDWRFGNRGDIHRLEKDIEDLLKSD